MAPGEHATPPGRRDPRALGGPRQIVPDLCGELVRRGEKRRFAALGEQFAMAIQIGRAHV